jgi:hypothetical protein
LTEEPYRQQYPRENALVRACPHEFAPQQVSSKFKSAVLVAARPLI